MRISVAVVVLLTASPAMAGGFSYPDLGTLPLSRGGAFVARADDPTLIWYNPAGATRLEGTSLLINTNVFMEDLRFQRRIYPMHSADPGLTVPVDRYPHDASLRIPEVQNQAGAAAVPMIGFVTDLGLAAMRRYRIRLLGGLYGPHAHPSRSFPRYCKDGLPICVPSDVPTRSPLPSRYDTTGTDILVLNPTLGLAWMPVRGLSIGAAFQATYASFTIRKSVAGMLPSRRGQPTEDPGQDMDVTIEARDVFTPSGVVGVHWRAFDFLELGFSAQLPVKNECTGTARVDIPTSVYGSTKVYVEPNPMPVRVPIRFPWLVRTGARYVQRDAAGEERFDVEADFTWEQTSDLDVLRVLTDAKLLFKDAVGVGIPVDNLNQAYYWKDTFGVRLGGTYRQPLGRALQLLLSAGFFYESAASDDAHTRLDFTPFERFGLAGGVGLRWRGWQLAVGYAHLFHPVRTVAPTVDPRQGCTQAGGGTCGSATQVIVPIAPDTGHPVGNGAYSFAVDLVTIGLQYRFGGTALAR
jgi:long-subunit fatty acid transport protein